MIGVSPKFFFDFADIHGNGLLFLLTPIKYHMEVGYESSAEHGCSDE